MEYMYGIFVKYFDFNFEENSEPELFTTDTEMEGNMSKSKYSDKSNTNGMKMNQVLRSKNQEYSTTDSELNEQHQTDTLSITKKKKVTKYIQGRKGRKFLPVKGTENHLILSIA